MWDSEICIVGAYEHPARKAPDRSVPELVADVVDGALADAGIAAEEVDAFLCDATLGPNPLSIIEYLGFDDVSQVDMTDVGGASYVMHAGHAVQALRSGACDVAVIAMAGKRQGRSSPPAYALPHEPFEGRLRLSQPSWYAMSAARHMHQYGTTPEQLASVRVAASRHASYNPDALLQEPVTIDDVLDSPMISDPLHRLDCCITSDSGGALVLVRGDRARDAPRPSVVVRSVASRIGHMRGGYAELGTTAARGSSAVALRRADVSIEDIAYASIYDSFTITVIETLEDLGVCQPGEAGEFVMEGGIDAPTGAFPINTDGGGLCNNHPGGRGGMPRTIEAVRQVRGEAHPRLQTRDCDIALVHGMGGSISSRHASVTMVLATKGA